MGSRILEKEEVEIVQEKEEIEDSRKIRSSKLILHIPYEIRGRGSMNRSCLQVSSTSSVYILCLLTYWFYWIPEFANEYDTVSYAFY